MAAAAHPIMISGRFSVPFDASRPAVNSSESPGRKKPTSSPDSAKTMANRPMVPNASIRDSGFIPAP